MSSEAAAAYQRLEPFNLQRHSDYLREQLVWIGAAAPGDPEHPRFPELFDAPLDRGLSRVTTEVLSALAALGYDRDRLDALTAGVSTDDGRPASYESFPDRTGLILVSDSLIILSSAYGEYLGRAIAATMSGNPLRVVARLLRTRWTGTIGEDPRLLAGVLRHHNICRRVHGVAAVLNFAGGPDLADPARELMLEFGMRFVVGHEAAHHLLGHGDPPGPAALSERREADADTLAVFAAARAYEQDTVELTGSLKQRWRQEMAEFHGLLGAIVTMLALQTSEQALMIRRGSTHQPTGDRMRLLAEHVLGERRQADLEQRLGRSDVRMTMRFEKERSALGVYLRNLLTATDLAADFTAGAAFDWAAFGRSPSIRLPPAGHLDEIAALDRLICGSDSTLAEEASSRLDAEGVRLIAAGDTGTGLVRLGVPEHRVAAFHDPARVLAFHTVVEAVEETRTVAGDSRRACVAAATLVARRLAA